MKPFIRFCLALGILLLGVHSQLYVHAYRHLIGSGSTETRNTAAFITGHHQQAFFIRLDGSGRRKEAPRKIFAEDNGDQDDKLAAFKRYLAVNNNFATSDYAHPSGYFCTYIKQCLSFCKLIPDIPSHIYIVLRVIRV